MTARKGNADLNFIINKLQGFAASGNFANVDLAYIWQLIGGGGGGGSPDHYLGNTNESYPGSHIITAAKQQLKLFTLASMQVSKQGINLGSTFNDWFIVDNDGYFIFDIFFNTRSTSSIQPGAVTLYIIDEFDNVIIRIPVIPSYYSDASNLRWGGFQYNFHCFLVHNINYKIVVHTDTTSTTAPNQYLTRYLMANSNYTTPFNLTFSLSLIKID